MLVPGLLQTEAYARAVLEATAEQPDIDDGMRTRMARQAILDRPDPPRMRVILDESVLWRVIGTADVQYDQLARLPNAPPSVIMQVLPRTTGAHRGVDGVSHDPGVRGRDAGDQRQRLAALCDHRRIGGGQDSPRKL